MARAKLALAFFGGGPVEQGNARTRLRTVVYVDGQNLYHRALRGTPYKWLDLRAVCELTLRPENEILAVRYFTANVSGRRDPASPNRQHAYLRALAAIGGVTVHRGRFIASERWAAVAHTPARFVQPAPEAVCVIRTEEKGSDVNLATWLLLDAFRGAFDVAVVMSNDTDLVEPIRIVREQLGKTVGIICPAAMAARSLVQVADFCRHLTPARLAAAQLPSVIPGTSIRRPDRWPVPGSPNPLP